MSRILGIDPGRMKCGLALADTEGVIIDSLVVGRQSLSAEVLRLCSSEPPIAILLGSGTASADVAGELKRAGIGPVELVDEAGTTLEARQRYFEDNPPGGWRRLLPRSFLLPPEEYDDFVARILIERYLGRRLVVSCSGISTP